MLNMLKGSDVPDMSKVSECSNECSDLELMRLVLDHDTRAFSILFQRYATRGIHVAQRVGMDYESSQDIVAESFIKIWNHADTFKPRRGKFSSWFYTIVHNMAIDELRRVKAYSKTKMRVLDEFLVSAPKDAPEDELFKKLDKVIVRATINKLPETQRQVIQLAYLEGMTRREIAQYLRLPLGTVYTRARAGMQRLTQLLQDEGVQVEPVQDVQTLAFAQVKA